MNAINFLDADPENRIDPMATVFPRVTKCTYRKYGPSGTIQNHDAMCVMPINIVNEKIPSIIVVIKESVINGVNTIIGISIQKTIKAHLIGASMYPLLKI